MFLKLGNSSDEPGIYPKRSRKMVHPYLLDVCGDETGQRRERFWLQDRHLPPEASNTLGIQQHSVLQAKMESGLFILQDGAYIVRYKRDGSNGKQAWTSGVELRRAYRLEVGGFGIQSIQPALPGPLRGEGYFPGPLQ